MQSYSNDLRPVKGCVEFRVCWVHFGSMAVSLLSTFCVRRALHVSAARLKAKAGRYKVTLNRNRPLTYEMAFKPEEIADKKGWNSFNTAQLEGTFLHYEDIGQDLPHQLLMDDMFLRIILRGTFVEMFATEVIIKRQHNLIRVAAIVQPKGGMTTNNIYFLVGYAETLLSAWLKCPVKMELQVITNSEEVVYKYI